MTVGLEHLDRLRVAWTPSPSAFAASPVGRMATRHGLPDMAALQAKATQDANWYWAAAAEDLGLRWTRRYDEIVDLSDGVPFARFFAGGRLNWTDCAVDRWVEEGRGNARAIAWEGDDGSTRELSYAELKHSVDRAAGALLRLGVTVGDTVGLMLADGSRGGGVAAGDRQDRGHRRADVQRLRIGGDTGTRRRSPTLGW